MKMVVVVHKTMFQYVCLTAAGQDGNYSNLKTSGGL